MIKKLLLFYLPISVAQIINAPILAFIYIPIAFIIISLKNIEYGIELVLFLIPFSFVFSKEIASMFGFGTMFIDNDALVFILFVINLIQYKQWNKEKINYKAPLLLLVVFNLGIINVKDIRLFLAELQRWVFLGLFAFVLIKRINKVEEFNRGLKAFLFGGLLASILGLLVHFSLLKFPDELGGVTFNRDSFINPQSDFIRYMGSGGFFIMFTFPLFFLTRLNKIIKVNDVFFVFSLIPLLLSFRRSAYMALIAAIIFLVIVYYKLNWKIIVFPILISGIILFVANDIKLMGGIVDRFISALTPQNDFTFLSRISYWLGAYRMFLDHPIIGIGLNQFPAYFDSYVSSEFTWQKVDITYAMVANNDYLQYLATTGIIGFVIIYYFLLGILLKFFKIVFHYINAYASYFAFMACLIIGFLVFGIVENPLADKNFLLFSLFFLINSNIIYKNFISENYIKNKI